VITSIIAGGFRPGRGSRDMLEKVWQKETVSKLSTSHGGPRTIGSGGI